MEKMREFMQSWLGKVVLVLVLVPMAFLGVQTFSGGAGVATDEVVKVGDVAVSLRDYEAEIANYKQELSAAVDASLIDEVALSDQVLQSMIDRALLENQSRFLGMTISDAAISNLLQQDATFHDANGQFSNDLFAAYLKNRGMSKEMLFDIFRTQLSLRHLTRSLLGTAIYPSKQISRLLDLQMQNREVWLQRYRWQDYASQVAVSSAEIEQYYHANKDKLVKSATVDLAYIELSAQSVNVPEPTQEELQAQYQAYLKESGAANKELAQILLTGDDAQNKAKELKAKLDAGQSFAALAKAHSQDPTGENGGHIGAFNPAVFGDDAKAVEAAIANLAVGQVSEPVKTSFGYQIFTVVKQPDAPSFDSVKAQMSELVKAHKRQAAFDEMVAKIDTMTVDGMSITDIAAAVGAKVHTIKEYSQKNNQTPLSAPSVIKAAFDEYILDNQSVSTNIALADKRVWLQPSNYQSAKTLALQEAEQLVKDKVVQQKASKLAFDAANKKAAEAKENPKAITAAMTHVGMINFAYQGLERAELASLFMHNDADKPSVWAVQTDQGATLMVGTPIVLNSQSRLSAADRLQASNIIKANVGEDQLQDYLYYLRDSKDVQINERALQQKQ
ncbi:MAG: SurA N-terminal domain-containing protein [Moraxella sp.]|nr:SurA N-terminal domain-containing protein [Moraxella sp.]